MVLTTLTKNVDNLTSSIKYARNFTEFAENLCYDYKFFSPNGRPQISTCSEALRTLESRELISLPWEAKTRTWTPETLDAPVPLPVPPHNLVALESAITLVRVEKPEENKIYNTLVKYENNNNINKLPPRPVKYLVKTTDGIIGAIAFTSPVINYGARESFIGWNKEEKDSYLHYVANLRIFIIREGYRDLGSLILEKALAALKTDYEKIYGIGLLIVEAIVPIEQVKAFSKHNWTLASSTKPLKISANKISKKNVQADKNTDTLFIYAYCSDYREKIAPHNAYTHGIENCLNQNNWVEKELNTSNYDKRLLRTTQNIIQEKFNAPQQSFLQCCNGSKSVQKAYYRAMETENENYNFENILDPFFTNTGMRASAYPIILWPSDGSDLNYSHLTHCKGLGLIGTSHKVPGLHLHATLGLTTNELVLGLGYATCGDIIHRDKDNKEYCYNIPLENKNSFVWYLHAERINELMKNCRVINVFLGDRGADDFGLYEYIINLPNMEFVIRSEYNRKLEGEDKKLHDAIREVPSMGQIELEIEYKRKNGSNKSNRGKNKKKKTKKNGKNIKKDTKNTENTEEPKKSNFGKRKASFHVAYKKVHLSPQSYRKNSSPIELTVVRGWEVAPIPSKKREEWILLTSLPVNSVEDAINCIKYYRSRWRCLCEISLYAKVSSPPKYSPKWSALFLDRQDFFRITLFLKKIATSKIINLIFYQNSTPIFCSIVKLLNLMIYY